jgi:hypothetical protein
MAYLRVASAALLVWLALLNAGVCYAAEGIALACSGSMTSSGSPREPIDDDEGIIVDLASGLVIWRDDAFPIVGNEGNMISFQSKMEPRAILWADQPVPQSRPPAGVTSLTESVASWPVRLGRA